VLGYSPVRFGLMTAVMTVMSVAGAYTAQAVVNRAGVRRVGAAGMALVGAACLVLTQVSAGGSYWPELFFGLLVFGAGLGSAFVAAQIAALTGAAERESGLAAGLADSSFNIGSALGIAILSTVAVSRAGPGAGLPAMTEGFQAAFAAAAGIGGLGAVLALLLLRPRVPDTSNAAAPAPAPGAEQLDGRRGQ
jgi:MFS family permease